jgi:hypothetical protein
MSFRRIPLWLLALLLAGVVVLINVAWFAWLAFENGSAP